MLSRNSLISTCRKRRESKVYFDVNTAGKRHIFLAFTLKNDLTLKSIQIKTICKQEKCKSYERRQPGNAYWQSG